MYSKAHSNICYNFFQDDEFSDPKAFPIYFLKKPWESEALARQNVKVLVKDLKYSYSVFDMDKFKFNVKLSTLMWLSDTFRLMYTGYVEIERETKNSGGQKTSSSWLQVISVLSSPLMG